MAGKELRLKQQYFFISASVQEAIARYKRNHDDIRKFYEKAAFQLNDTHPTVAVAELMRILIDEEGLEWDEAWDVTTKTALPLLSGRQASLQSPPVLLLLSLIHI